MRLLFNSKNEPSEIYLAYNAVKRVLTVMFAAAKTDLDLTQALKDYLTAGKKITHLFDVIAAQPESVRIKFFTNAYTAQTNKDSPATIMDLCRLLDSGIKQCESGSNFDPEPSYESATGKLVYHAGLFSKWYKGLDTRMHSVFDRDIKTFPDLRTAILYHTMPGEYIFQDNKVKMRLVNGRTADPDPSDW